MNTYFTCIVTEISDPYQESCFIIFLFQITTITLYFVNSTVVFGYFHVGSYII